MLPLAALYPHPLVAQPSLLATSALRATSSGATMTTPGGTDTIPRRVSSNILYMLGDSASLIRVGASTLRGFGPSRERRDDEGNTTSSTGSHASFGNNHGGGMWPRGGCPP